MTGEEIGASAVRNGGATCGGPLYVPVHDLVDGRCVKYRHAVCVHTTHARRVSKDNNIGLRKLPVELNEKERTPSIARSVKLVDVLSVRPGVASHYFNDLLFLSKLP